MHSPDLHMYKPVKLSVRSDDCTFSEATASVDMSLFSFLFATMDISVHSCNGCVCELIYLALIEEFAYLVYSRLVVIWYIMFIFVVLFTGFIKYWMLLEALYSS